MNIRDMIHRLSLRQTLALRLLDRVGTATPTELAREAHTSSAAATTIKDRLVRDKLAIETRGGSEDRRLTHITITDHGRAVWLEIDALLNPKAAA